MKYKITVTQIEKDVPYESREWERQWDDAVYERLSRSENPPESQYAYVVKEDTKTVVTEVYEQMVDELDMGELVRVVNKVNTTQKLNIVPAKEQA